MMKSEAVNLVKAYLKEAGKAILMKDAELCNAMVEHAIYNRQQFDGNNFKSSEDLSSLPQIVNLVKTVNIGSFWGESESCNVGITRVDFDLRDQNINIEPTSLFMGSIFSSNDEDYLKTNCKPCAVLLISPRP